MNMTYKDRNGKVLGFDLNVTPYQAVLLRRVLNAVRATVQRLALTLPYLADVDENDAFLSDVEGTVLSALSERYALPRPTDAPQVAGAVKLTGATQGRERNYWGQFKHRPGYEPRR